MKLNWKTGLLAAGAAVAAWAGWRWHNTIEIAPGTLSIGLLVGQHLKPMAPVASINSLGAQPLSAEMGGYKAIQAGNSVIAWSDGSFTQVSVS